MSDNVIAFPGGDPGELTNLEFWANIWGSENIERTGEAIAKLGHLKKYARITPVKTGFLNESIEFGTVLRAPKSTFKENGVIVDAGFPRALKAYAGLNRQESLELAASFVSSFSYVVHKFDQARRRQDFTRAPQPNFESQYWQMPYADAPNGNLALPYRLSGAIALEATGLEPIQIISPEPPHPPHIAGLENPFPAYEVKMFTNNVLK